FGGLYPNPAVTGAAVAMITESVQIRSGSVVAPLHSPIRIAEEWSVVDNLSRGRAAIAFASGWMPEDFVIRPDDFDDKKGATFSHLETVRKLWRGEAVDFPAPNGETVAVQTLPRPIQPELPVWVTTAGNPETYEAAARAGAHVLTHLLGQSVEEVGEKVAIYRQAWREAGHPGNGHISLMVHTLVGADHDDVREIVREPLKEYLRTAANLLKTYSSAFPTFRNQGINAEDVNFGALPDEDLEAVLDFAFLRYIETSGLFGTPESSMDLIDRIRDNDIDEVACLIDFGVPTDVVLDNLPHLDRLRAATNATAEDADESIASLIGRHDVTHFQCTPSMARMLLTDEPTCAAMSTLEVMMVGGEACSVSLAEELLATVEGRVINMYGPTETTIWSGTQVLLGEDGPVPIGRPILNTHFFVVNEEMQAQPVGVPGELLIGGPGVTRGYLNREALTAERFIASPFAVDGSPTLYRTGDLVRYLPDSRVEFIGRIDHQVKIRGHRIELGEIETCINHHPSVREAVVMAREDVPGDLRLVAYVTTVQHADVSPTDIRDHVRDRLPEYMVPSRVVALDEFPQTPNKKVDRKALPAPGDDPQDAGDALESPTGVIEETIASLWSDVLGIATLGRHDDFFELGGDSLSLVHVTARISDVFEQKVSIGAFVTAPTIAAVASLIDGPAADQASGAAPAADVDAPGVTTTRPMREDDLDAVIGLHEQHFPDWAVTMLGSGFLRQMYHWYMESHGDLAIVAARDGAVTGFTVGTVGPYKARLLRFALPEAVRGVATNPIDLLRHRVGSIRGNKTNGEPATEDPRMDDPTLANNRIMAVSPGDSDSALALLVAFEKAAAQRGTEPFFHDDVPTG
ncbi:MAG: MupA/Atu3671 family FMN-dependent luciferase-like monooxygenase, partial [Actinomycetota bacterium]